MNEKKTKYLRELTDELRVTKIWRRQHDKQIEFSRATEPIRAFFAGNRTGKTHVAAQEVCRFLFNAHETRKIKLPVEIWCACPSFDQQRETTQAKLVEMIPKHRIRDITYVKKGVWSRVDIDNGSVVSFKSYDQGREKFQGVGKRLIWFDEEPPKDIWEEAFVRVEAGMPLDIILTMTPVNGMTWVYDQIYLSDSRDIKVITAGWRDNPWLTKDQTDQMSRGLSDEALEVRQKGHFVRQTGLVCPWWNRDMLRDGLEVGTSDNLWRIVDFGWSSSKTCVLWLGITSRDQVYLFDGIYENALDDEKLARLILERERDRGIKVVRSLGDNQPDRLNILRRNKVSIKAIDKTTGVDNWDEFRAEAMHKVGQMGFKVAKHLTVYDPEVGSRVNWFVREIEQLRWKSRKIEGITRAMKRWDKDSSPMKGSHFDAIDAFSYFCAEYIRKTSPYQDKELQKKRRQLQALKRGKRIINPITGY